MRGPCPRPQGATRAVSHDVVIIGGGVAGLSAAAALAPGGRVALLEAEAVLGHHASGRSAALFAENYGSATVRALNRASRAAHEAAGVLSPRGLLLVGPDEGTAAEAEALGLARVTIEEARAWVPILDPQAVGFAAANPATPGIDTDRLMQGHARAARSHGAEIVTGAPATAIRPGWVVETPVGAFEAPVIVNAAGAWADAVAAMAGVEPLGLVPHRRSMAVIPAPGGHDVSGWPLLMGPGEGWYAKPEAGRLLVSPAEEDACEPHDAYADDLVLAEGLARYESYVTEPVTRVLRSWAGLRTFAPDRALVIGWEPAAPGFLWLAGQGGYGFQTAPAAAALAAALVSGAAPEIDGATVAALAPARLRVR